MGRRADRQQASKQASKSAKRKDEPRPTLAIAAPQKKLPRTPTQRRKRAQTKENKIPVELTPHSSKWLTHTAVHDTKSTTMVDRVGVRDWASCIRVVHSQVSV